jgi:predicted phosphodiesterase
MGTMGRNFYVKDYEMAKQNTPFKKSNLAAQLIREFPDTSSKQLARIACERWPEAFFSMEQARSCLRSVRGAKGDRNRQEYKTLIPRSKADAERCKRLGALLPDAEPNKWKMNVLPDGPTKWLGIADPHIPYHCKLTLQVQLQYAKKQHCDGVILLGDIVDFYNLSKFVKDPTARDTVGEVNATEQYLIAIIKYLKPKKIVYKCGNHDERINTYLMSRAAELYGLPQVTIQSILKLEEKNIDFIPGNEMITFEKMAFAHGHEWGGGFYSPVNPARSAFLRAHDCVMVGHEHRTSEHVEPRLSGFNVTTWSVGASCDLHPQYRPFNRWNHGLFIFDLTKDNWRIDNRRIINGEVM